MAWFFTVSVVLLEVSVVLGMSAHILLRRSGSTETRLAWILLIILLPLAGAIAYLLLGEPRIRGRAQRHRLIRGSMAGELRARPEDLPRLEPDLPRHYQQVFTLAEKLSDTDAMSGHELELMGTTEGFFDHLIADIEAATTTVHILTYIILDDEGGRRVTDALMEASRRGVVCKLLVDAMGSRLFLQSRTRQELERADVQIVESLPTRLWAMLWRRMDIRNHRKIALIDNKIGWIGSQNLASASFGIKPRFAPWVDCMVRLRGPAVHDLQELFIEDWRLDSDENLGDLLQETPEVLSSASTVQIIGTGPNFRNEVLAMIFQAAIGAAEDELIITTPYFVPVTEIIAALRAAALRGVDVTLIVPAKNDSRLVALASRGHYSTLLSAGVRIHEFEGGLLHAKTMTVDRQLFVVGSANLDRRSLELNFEVSMIGWDDQFASQLRFLQVQYIEQSREVTAAGWKRCPLGQRLANNAAGLLSPLL